MIEKLLKHDIAVYAAHTNLDIAEGGVNDLLAEALDLKIRKCLCRPMKQLEKIVVFVPSEKAEQVRRPWEMLEQVRLAITAIVYFRPRDRTILTW